MFLSLLLSLSFFLSFFPFFSSISKQEEKVNFSQFLTIITAALLYPISGIWLQFGNCANRPGYVEAGASSNSILWGFFFIGRCCCWFLIARINPSHPVWFGIRGKSSNSVDIIRSIFDLNRDWSWFMYSYIHVFISMFHIVLGWFNLPLSLLS